MHCIKQLFRFASHCSFVASHRHSNGNRSRSFCTLIMQRLRRSCQLQLGLFRCRLRHRLLQIWIVKLRS